MPIAPLLRRSLKDSKSPKVASQILVKGKWTKPMKFYILIKKRASGQLNYQFRSNASVIGTPAVP